MKPGTLVILIKPLKDMHPNLPEVGAIGEIINHSGNPDWGIRSECVVVNFPRNISHHSTGFWQIARTSLIPISNPDIEIEEYEDAPVEENSETV